MVSLGELAVRFGCELRGDPELRVGAVAALDGATAGTLTFLANPRLRSQLAATQATAVVLAPDAASDCPVAALIAPNPHATFARIAAVLHPSPPIAPGVHPSAVVAAGARIDPTAQIGPLAVIADGVVVGARSFIGPGSVIEQGVSIGDDSRLVARVVIGPGVVLGARAIVQPGAVIGSDGFGYANDKGCWIKVPQVGTVRVGMDVEIGSNTTIDRGAIGDTVIGDGVKLDNQIQIGHNVYVGDHTAMAACVGVSGSTRIGKRCMIAGAVGIVGHLTICDDVVVTGMSMVSHSITKPGVYSGGIPAESAEDWRRIVGRLKRIDGLAKRVSQLEKQDGAERDDD